MITSLDKKQSQDSTQRNGIRSGAGNQAIWCESSVLQRPISPDAATFKVEVATVSTDGVVNTKKVAEFKHCCHQYGLKEEHLGFTLPIMGCSIKLADYPSVRCVIPSLPIVYLTAKPSNFRKAQLPV